MKRRLRLSLGAWQRLAPKVDRDRSQLKLRSSLAYWLSGVVHSFLFHLQDASHADVLKAAFHPRQFLCLAFGVRVRRYCMNSYVKIRNSDFPALTPA